MKTLKWILIGALCATAFGCGNRGNHADYRTKASSADALNFGEGVGSVCGSPTILGKREASFGGRGCGIKNPVRIYAVGGIKLSTPAQVNCKTAQSLEQWVNASAKPTASKINKELSGLKIAASYACRTRNHKKGAKLSEHAKGNAVDISGFSFTDGTTLTVEDAYHRYENYFATVRRQACGSFGTVLGPGVRLHNDHFHFDTASYSYGPYCK